MENVFLLLGAAAIGFSHSFEADHLVAVSSIVTRRNSTISAIKDGIFWGLGHTSTILVVASIYMIGKFIMQINTFRYFEAGVGVMLMGLGFIRFYRVFQERSHEHTHASEPTFGLAYGVGLVHGLAGSGGLLLSVLTQIKDNFMAIIYILIFGIGSIFGMMLAAGIVSLPFSAKFINNKWFSTTLSIASAMLCVCLGAMIFYKNIFKMDKQPSYNEADFVEYALTQMDIKILKRKGNFFDLERGFSIEVEGTELYRLSSEGWVISPFNDVGKMCEFIKKNLEIALKDE